MIVERAVQLSPADCALIMGALINAEAEAHRNGGHLDDRTREIKNEIVEVGKAHRSGSARGTEVVTSAEAARRLGMSDRWVRSPAMRERLGGRKVGGVWMFDERLVAAHDGHNPARAGGDRPAAAGLPVVRPGRR